MSGFSQDLACALDPVLFAKERLHYTPDAYQEPILRTKEDQVAILGGRQIGKTQMTATKGVHCAVYRPGSLVLCIAPSQRQSELWFATAMTLLKRVTPAEGLERDSVRTAVLANRSKIVALPAEPSRVRGYSAVDTLIADEAAFIEHSESLFKALIPMLAVSKGQLILSSSANGQSGFFFNVFQNGGADWQRFIITADKCPRISREWLEREGSRMTRSDFEQEFFCRFASPHDSFLDYETIRSAFDPKVKPLFGDAQLARLAAAGGAR